MFSFKVPINPNSNEYLIKQKKTGNFFVYITSI